MFKALTLNADTLILIWKIQSRRRTRKQPEGRFATGLNRQTLAKECLVRINPQDSPCGRDDAEACCGASGWAGASKVSSRASVDAVDQLVSD